MDRPDELIGITEAARLLGVHRTTLLHWLRQGRIPAFQYGSGGLYRLRRGDALAYIEASRIGRDVGRAEPSRDAEHPSPSCGPPYGGVVGEE
jgi:excisionase family DNA binding protein